MKKGRSDSRKRGEFLQKFRLLSSKFLFLGLSKENKKILDYCTQENTIKELIDMLLCIGKKNSEEKRKN